MLEKYIWTQNTSFGNSVKLVAEKREQGIVYIFF